MRGCLLTITFVLSACSQAPETVAVDNAADTDTMTTAASPDPSSDGGKPFDVPSDSKARYYLLNVEDGEAGRIIATSRREGPSGTSYARREIDCSARLFRYVGEGDTLAEAQQPAPNPGEMSGLVEGSISDEAVKFACANR